MEEQLVQQHMELERVVALRTEPNTEGGVGYLCKWRGLPYSEATWENKALIQKMDNGLAMAQSYQASPQPCPKTAIHLLQVALSEYTLLAGPATFAFSPIHNSHSRTGSFFTLVPPLAPPLPAPG